MTTTKIALLGCGKAKLAIPAPARELYTGSLFRAALRLVDAGGFYFLGRAGAVRYGACASKSRAASDAFKNKLLGAGPATVFRANAGDWLEGADAAPCAAGWYRRLPSGDRRR